jgi:hypothetical protein
MNDILKTDLRTADEEALKRYLLGELSEDEQSCQEERLLTEKHCYELLVLLEDDLVDDYLHGKLSPREKEGMEQRFLLSPRRQEKLRLAKDLKQYAVDSACFERRDRSLDQPRGRIAALVSLRLFSRRITMALLTSAALLLIAGLGALFWEITTLRGRVEALNQEQVSARQREEELHGRLADQLAIEERLSRELEQERIQRKQLEKASSGSKPPATTSGESIIDSALVSLALAPGRVRDAGQSSLIEIPPSAKRLLLLLSLEQGGHKSYHAVIQTDEGKQIWSRDGLTARWVKDDDRVTIVVPSELLPPGDYTILLSPTSGRNRVGTYYFTVSRKTR